MQILLYFLVDRYNIAVSEYNIVTQSMRTDGVIFLLTNQLKCG